MQRPPNAPLSAAVGLVLLLIVPLSNANSSAPTAEANRSLKRGDASGAIAVLEQALPKASRDERPALLDGLLNAYSAALKSAEAAGRNDEAEALRDNIEILKRKRQTIPGPAKSAVFPPVLSKSGPALLSAEPVAPLPDAPVTPMRVQNVVKATIVPRGELPPAEPLPEVKPLPPAAPLDAPVTANFEKPSVPNHAKAPGSLAEPNEPGETLHSADAAFLAGRYEEAGGRYSAFAASSMLPDDRRSHWAYCRAVAVVKKINDRPTSAAEWAPIDYEIRAIQTLSPNNWFAEYLRNLASERSRVGRSQKTRPNSRMVVRGSSPEEQDTGKAKASPGKPQNANSAPLRVATKRLPGSKLEWNGQPVTSANFEVHFIGDDAAPARQIAQAAEQARAVQARHLGAEEGGRWTPRCEILLYPSADEFGKDTKQPADSPGFSTMGMNAGKIVFRRVHLRANHAAMVKAILPHEVTHVVLADVFPEQQIPRWADEGLAVLAEPISEQAVRATDLEEPLKAGKLFRLSDLMAMDYPDPKHWSLYYAQSVSLTRFLVDSGTPEQFIAFVKRAQSDGFEPALLAVYEIGSFSDLQTRWLAFAKERAAGATRVAASSRDPEKKSAEETTR